MTTEAPTLKRVKRKIKSSRNPLFEKWLREWKEEAASKGSEMQYCFGRALKSLQKFPVKLYSGKECMMLENFGAKLCQRLDEKLEDYKASHPEDRSVYPPTKDECTSDLITTSEIVTKVRKKRTSSELSPVKKKKLQSETDNSCESKPKTSNYVPVYRSGGYAILVAMYKKSQENDFKGSLTRDEIESHAQDLCEMSFKKPIPGSYVTAWSSMSILIKKKLVIKEGKPPRFSLTEEGVNLAVKLEQIHTQFEKAEGNLISTKKTVQVQINQKSPVQKRNEGKVASQKETEPEREPVSEVEETTFLMPGTFEIILLVDTQERDDKTQHSDGMTMRELQSRQVNFEIRHLKVGDFIWIARDLQNGAELVLPYIVERKRLDDLASSIRDGRFHEQKFRLKQSGIENLVYLVEKYGHENQRLGLPLPSLKQAISNTQIVDGFTVRVTNSHNHSMRYLDCMTTQLNNLFKTKTLMSCKKSNLTPANLSDELISLMTFKDFNEGSEKNKRPSVRKMLAKHLLQLNGVSLEKAQVIVQSYPTPKALMEGLKHPTAEKLLAELTYGNFKRAIGPAIAKQIRMLYTSTDLK